MIKCQNCRKELDEEDKRCPYCMGVPATYCNKCGGITATEEFSFREAVCLCKEE